MYRKRERCQWSTNNPLTAKVHDLSYKIVPRDSSLIATKDSCKQAQAGPPTRSPSKMFHRKTSLEECSSSTPNSLQQIPSPSTSQTNVLLQTRLDKQRMKISEQRDLNTRMRGLFRKAKCPYQKDFYPYLSSRSLSSLLISILC